MTPSRKQPGVAFWATVVVVVGLVAYPLSFGPACWIASRRTNDHAHLPALYSPIARIITSGPALLRGPAHKFAMLGMPVNRKIFIFVGPNQQSLVIETTQVDWHVHER